MLPDEIRFKTNTLLRIALSPAGAFILGGVVVLLVRKWPTDNAAAWVQAIGSIGAILGAFMIASRTHRLERVAARENDLGVEIKAVVLAEGVVQEAVLALEAAIRSPTNPDLVPSNLRRMESVHQALMFAISQPVSEQALKPILRTLQRISDACGILQEAAASRGTVMFQGRDTMTRHLREARIHREVLDTILLEIRGRTRRKI